MEYITKSAEETKELGARLSTDLKGKIIALSGNLGSGKTTFVQGLAKGLGVKTAIISPTFILMRTYKAKDSNFYHIDLYRLEGDLKDEVQNLGLTSLFNEGGTMVIEWAQKISKYLPKDTIYIKFEEAGENERKIVIND